MKTDNHSALEFQQVSLSFDEKKVLTDINFKLEQGQMIFVTGVSGSGKSVMLRLAMGLDRPDKGKILIEGHDVALLTESDLLELRGSRMGMVFQEDSLFTGLTVYENVAYRLEERGVEEDEIERSVMEVLHFVGLENDAEKLPAELSGGMRRRLEIARGLIGWPSIMLYDEPALGLDPLTALQVLDLIVRARDVYGISAIYVTKKLDEIPYLATHRALTLPSGEVVVEEASVDALPNTSVIVLDAGRVVFTGSASEFEASTKPGVLRLTAAFAHAAVPALAPADPWDKRRHPNHRVL
jgi:phospholipid/cholesterol/gamma-HCH transport system ATP-binding protein